MVAELLQVFSWIIGPLVIFVAKRDSVFVGFHALQVVLWQILQMVVSFLLASIVMFIGVMAPYRSGTGFAAFELFLFTFFALLGLFSLANFMLAIYFAAKASGGAWTSYPVAGRIARSILRV
jgi:uncharacterized Tic20 family protein